MNPYMYPGLDHRVSMAFKRTVMMPDEIIEHILEKVCQFYGIPKKVVVSKLRKREVVQARQQYCWIMKEGYNSNATLKRIGSFVGKLDHSTVIHACDTVNDLKDTDKGYRSELSKLLNILNNDEYLIDSLKVLEV